MTGSGITDNWRLLGETNIVDNLTPDKRSKIMRSIHGRDTRPELIVRHLVHGMGYRYRLHRKDLPGQPDIVFASRRAVIFVHGCFWHLHHSCKISHIPDSSKWQQKLLANRARDDNATRALQSSGWKVLVIWECEVLGSQRLEKVIKSFLGLPRPNHQG